MTTARVLALHAAFHLVEGLAEIPVWVGRAARATSQRLCRLHVLTGDAEIALWRASVWLVAQAEVRRSPSHDDEAPRPRITVSALSPGLWHWRAWCSEHGYIVESFHRIDAVIAARRHDIWSHPDVDVEAVGWES